MGGLLGDKASFIVTAVLFVVDYLAEMYDPHPENPGPWFKTHFHRFLHPTDEDEEFDRWFHCKDIEHIFERD